MTNDSQERYLHVDQSAAKLAANRIRTQDHTLQFQNLDELPKRFRRFFPITEQFVYLNHASVSPLSQPARDGMMRALDGSMLRGPRISDEMDEILATARCRAAKLV